jgi:hypothetical protein
MKNLIVVVLAVMLVGAFCSVVFADVWVNGYYDSDGTYVQGQWSSSLDGQKWNDYGPATNQSESLYPFTRDWDKDGLPNMYDYDDDNDGILDDYDNDQYGNEM